jgi:hypothetical protein
MPKTASFGINSFREQVSFIVSETSAVSVSSIERIRSGDAAGPRASRREDK